MTTEMTGKDLLSLSDEDFLKQIPPSSNAGEGSGEQETQEETQGTGNEQTQEVETEVEESKGEKDNPEDSTKVEKDGNVSTTVEVEQKGEKGTVAVTKDPAKTAVSEKGDGQKEKGKDPATSGDDASKTDSQTASVDYEQEYKRILAPFKANGKIVEPRTPEEAIQLMQMGANYTRKMQEIQPHRKTLLMLEKNGLDQDKLAFLIDVSNGNPEAIKKLLKDKGVDPLSIDTSEAPNYLGGNHQVSDEEANFRTTLDDIASHPEGKATLSLVNSTWDQASKDVIWKDPKVLTAIHDHRESGIYDVITSEVDRLKTLGEIPVGTPFIQAYKGVGDMLQAQGKLAGKTATTSTTATKAVVTDEPIATRVATTKTVVKNGAQASAASVTRTSPRNVEKAVNPLAMSDDDFLKQMANRV